MRRWIENHADIGHSTIGLLAMGTLLTHAGGVDADVAHGSAQGISMPIPGLFAAEGLSFLVMLDNPLANGFGGAFHGGLAQMNSGGFVEQFGAFLERVRDGPAKGRQAFDRGR